MNWEAFWLTVRLAALVSALLIVDRNSRSPTG